MQHNPVQPRDHRSVSAARPTLVEAGNKITYCCRDRSAIPRPISLICSHSRARKIRLVPCWPRTSFRPAGWTQSSRTRSIIRSSFAERKWLASATPPNSRQPTRKFASVAGSTALNAARQTASLSSAAPVTLPDGQTLRFLVGDEKGSIHARRQLPRLCGDALRSVHPRLANSCGS